MITQQELQGNWNEIKGQLQDRWGQLTEDELARVKGNVKQLVGTVQRKTGESKEQVERFLETVAHNGSSAIESAAEEARQYASQAGEVLHEQYAQAADAVAAGLEGAQNSVRRRPVESVAVAFGAGLIAGTVAGLLLRGRD